MLDHLNAGSSDGHSMSEFSFVFQFTVVLTLSSISSDNLSSDCHDPESKEQR